MSQRLRVTFDTADRDLAWTLLRDCDMPRDRLPYTPEFETLYECFLARSGRQIDRAAFWRLLSSAAKQGGLSKR